MKGKDDDNTTMRMAVSVQGISNVYGDKRHSIDNYMIGNKRTNE